MNVYWKVGRNGAWETARNWSPGAPGAADDVFIEAGGSYTVTLSSAATIGSLTIDGATLHEFSGGSLTTDSITLDQATLQLDAANSGITGTLAATDTMIIVGASDAFGGAVVTLDAGAMLLAAANSTLSNQFKFDQAGSSTETFAAAHGVTLTLDGSSSQAQSLIIGSAGDDGTVTLNFEESGSPVSITATVAAGTLDLAAEQRFTNLVVDPGATIVGGQYCGVDNLVDNGTISSGFFEVKGSFSGSGALASATKIILIDSTIDFSGTVDLSGGVMEDHGSTGSFSGAFEIDSGTLSIYDGSTMRLAGAVDISGVINEFSGALLIVSGAGVIGGAIAGANHTGGDLQFTGSGQVALNGAVSDITVIQQGTGSLVLGAGGFSTVLEVYSGTTILNSPGALASSATIDLYGGLVYASASGTTAAGITVGDHALLAAAHGQTLTLTGALASADAGSHLTVGTATDDGVIAIGAGSSNLGGIGQLEIADGTLRLGRNISLGTGTRVAIDAGATLDLAGHQINLYGAALAGAIVNSGAATTLSLGNDYVTGAIGGGIAVAIAAPNSAVPEVLFAADQSYTGATSISAGATLVLGDGGATGSIQSSTVSIAAGGVLKANRSDALTIGATIGGGGAFD